MPPTNLHTVLCFAATDPTGGAGLLYCFAAN